jgi:hypothetical protein
MLYPPLIDSPIISEDARERIRVISSKLTTPIGAYTANSKGHMYVR